MKTLLAFLMFAAATATATPILDQEAPNLGGGFAFTEILQQEVIAGIAGKLVGVSYFPEGGSSYGGTHQFSISLGAPWHWDEPDWTSLQTINWPEDFFEGGKYVDVSSAGIYLEPGDRFTLWWMKSGNARGAVRGNYGGDYPGKAWWRNPNEQVMPKDVGWAIAFRTYVEPITAVPEPATWVLLFVGILAVWSGRRMEARNE